MNVLMIHQNFPGQFRHLAPALVQAGHQVTALVLGPGQPRTWYGVNVIPYQIQREPVAPAHPWLTNLQPGVIVGEACLQTALQLKAQGYQPDLIIAHPGWGESLFIDQAWPDARIGLYCELFNHIEFSAAYFDPEFAGPESLMEKNCRLRVSNLVLSAQFAQASAGISPMPWQAASFPPSFREKITVVHDGVDTTALRPSSRARLLLNESTSVCKGDEVVTFAASALEPLRGFHILMQALPKVLRERPQAQVIVVGSEGPGYGAPPSDGGCWRDLLAQELFATLNEAERKRVHFVGQVPHELFTEILQVSAVHAYLTYPHVLSWSLLESMSVGCALVASDTAPVRDALEDGVNAKLVPFHDAEALANGIVELLKNPEMAAALGAEARQTAIDHFDLHSMCLPRQLAWVEALANYQ